LAWQVKKLSGFNQDLFYKEKEMKSFLNTVRHYIKIIPLHLAIYWPLGLIALVASLFLPWLGLALCLSYLVTLFDTISFPAAPSGNGAGAWGDLALIACSIVGAFLFGISSVIGFLI
jgi:hypothetical protein